MAAEEEGWRFAAIAARTAARGLPLLLPFPGAMGEVALLSLLRAVNIALGARALDTQVAAASLAAAAKAAISAAREARDAAFDARAAPAAEFAAADAEDARASAACGLALATGRAVACAVAGNAGWAAEAAAGAEDEVAAFAATLELAFVDAVRAAGMVDGGGSALGAELLARPLWPQPDAALEGAKGQFVHALRGSAGGFGIWADWYEGVWRGRIDRDFVRCVALMPEELVEQGVAAVNGYLRGGPAGAS